MSTDSQDAQRVADSQSDNDPGQEQGQCPLTRPDLQLIPVRYAMVEAPEAERAAATPGFSPAYGGSFRHCGVRPVRKGWLYLVHSETPDELQVFEVEPDGSGDEIIVERQGSIQVLFSLVELTSLHESMLKQEAFREQVMTRVNIGAYCPGNGTAHLLDPDALIEVLADDHGEHRQTPDAPDQEDAEAELDTGSYAWCDSEAEEWQASNAATIKSAIQEDYQEDSVCLLVEDIPGRIKDLTQAWACLAAQQGDWLDKHQTEHFAATTIDGLMTLNFEPHVEHAGAGNIPEWLGEAGDEERDDLQALAELYSQHRETEEAVTVSSGGHPGFIGRALQPIERDIDGLSQQLAERLGTDAEQVKDFVERTERDHFREVIGGNYTLAPNGIVDVIRQQEMEDFLAYANPMQEQWQGDYRCIGDDLAAILGSWHLHALLLDREDERQILVTCLLEKAAVETLLACGQNEFLTRHYAGDTLGAGHLLHYSPTEHFVGTFLSQPDGIQQSLAHAAALMAASGALKNYQEWRASVEGQSGLRFRSVEGLSNESRAAIAGEVQHKEKMLGDAVLGTLLDEVQDLDLGERLSTLADRLPEGQRLMFAERLGLLELGWDIPDGSVLARLQGALDQAESAVANLTTLEDELRRLRQERQVEIERASQRGTSQAHRRAADNFNARRIRDKIADIKREQRRLGDAMEALMEHSFPVNEEGSHALKVGGLSLAATRAALSERTADRAIARQPRATLRETLNTLVRNEQNEVSVTRALGVMVNGSLSALGAVIACVAMNDLIKSWGKERFLEHIGHAGSQGVGTAAAVMAIREMIIDARHRKLYAGRSFSQVADPTLRAAAGSPAQLESWARVANRAMSAVALLGGVAGFFEAIRQSQRLGRTETQAERLATYVALAGASGTALGGGFLGGMGLAGRILGAPAAQWRLVMLQFAGPVGWFVAASTLLLVVGDMLASRFSLSPVQSWCQRSYWGQRSENWGMETHEQELGKISGSEASVERQGVAVAHAGPGPGPAASDLAFRLIMPGGEPPNEETLSFGLWGVPMSGSHQELTRDVLAHAHGDADVPGSAVIYHLAPEVLSQYHFVRLVVQSRLYGESSTRVYELHRRGRSLSNEWHEVSALTNGFFRSIKAGNWSSMPLTPWAP